MNDYIGKICPYCKTEFKADDDIIVCSQCDMPHHKDCWIENQGCTTFGCLGTIKAADNGASSVTATQINFEDSGGTATHNVFCTQCGTKNSSTDTFCSACGAKLVTDLAQSHQPPVYTQANPANTNPYSYVNQQFQPNQPNQSNIYQPYRFAGVDAETQQLIGTNTEYYIPKFQSMRSQGKSASWNWPAFLVTPYWMIYRKMYGYGAIFLVVDMIIKLINSKILSFASLGGYIVFGILGNSIYMKHIESEVNQAKAMIEPNKTQFIANNGGVNTLATVLTIIGSAVFSLILLL